MKILCLLFYFQLCVWESGVQACKHSTQRTEVESDTKQHRTELGPRQEQYKLLTTRLSLQTQNFHT